MITFLTAVLLWVGPGSGTACFHSPILAPCGVAGGDGTGAPQTERVVLKKDGGPGCGPDQPYSIREMGASDLERFVGGKQVVFVAPYDLFVVLLLVALIIVLVIVL